MKYSTAVGRVRTISESLSRESSLGETMVTGAFAFGDLLTGPESLDVVSMAFVLDLPASEVPWCARPRKAEALADHLRLTKVPVERWWRPIEWPVWNHRIINPVQVWSLRDGIHDDALSLLSEGRFGDLNYRAPGTREELGDQLRAERRAARHHLDEVLDRYHDREWQQEHRFGYMRPDDHLWWAAYAFHDLDEAIRDHLADQHT